MSETGVTGQPDIQAVTFTPAHYSTAPLGPLQPSSMTSGPRTAPSGPGSWSSLLWLLAWEDMGGLRSSQPNSLSVVSLEHHLPPEVWQAGQSTTMALSLASTFGGEVWS